MKRIKITLPKGGTKAFTNDRDNFPPVKISAHTVTYEADEIIIEGDVSLTQAPAARIPFDLEAAKAGAQVLWGDDPVRWVDLGNVSSSIGAHNIIEHSHGLAYAPDKDLFMAPRTVWVNLYKNQSSAYYESAEEAREKALPSAIARAVSIKV